MGSHYSIAEAKNQLPRLVHEAEEGEAVHLTRRGRPVAVMMSVATYERLARRGSFHWAMNDFRARFQVDSLGIDPEQLAATRDPAPGREVAL
jgi:prevent-host-death family protein